MSVKTYRELRALDIGNRATFDFPPFQRALFLDGRRGCRVWFCFH